LESVHLQINLFGLRTVNSVITIKSDQRDALACENAALSQVERFEAHAAEQQAANVAKTPSDNTQGKPPAPKPPTSGTPRPPSAKKGTHVASGSNQPPADL
jgi:hypothetical protein